MLTGYDSVINWLFPHGFSIYGNYSMDAIKNYCVANTLLSAGPVWGHLSWLTPRAVNWPAAAVAICPTYFQRVVHWHKKTRIRPTPLLSHYKVF